MPRKLRSPSLENRTRRLALAVRGKPYTLHLDRGIRLAYRRNNSAGVWSVLKANGDGTTWLQKFAKADDFEDSNGSTVLSFFEAADTARKLARNEDVGGEIDAGKPMTVSDAVTHYEHDIVARDGDIRNARWLRFHLSSAIMSKPVAMLLAREIKAIRNGLLDKGLTRASGNRFMKAFAACLNLAARDDERITNTKAWRLPGLPDATEARNVVLTDEQICAVVAESYNFGLWFGLYVELLAVTGTRPIQARRLTVADLEIDHRGGPRVMMPSSKKGKGRKRIDRTALPIPAALAARLKADAHGRAADEPLFRDDNGNALTVNSHARPFARAAAKAKLPAAATCYTLRHSFITRSLLRGIPVRLVAASVDSSVPMIEKTYSKYISNHGDEMLRANMLDLDAPVAADNVVKLTRGK